MKIQLLKMFLDEFRKRKKKTALITFAISWGALSLLLMMSFGRGLSTQSQIGLKGLGVDLILFSSGTTSKEYQGLPKGRRIRLYAEDVELIRKLVPEVKSICGESYVYSVISYNGRETNRSLHGTTAEFSAMRTMYAQMGGRFLNPDDVKYSRRVAFLGWNIAEEMFGKESPIGKQIKINGSPFKVIGVMKKKLQTSNYQGQDYDHVFIPLTTMAQVNSQQFIDMIHIQPKEREMAGSVQRQVKQILGKKYRFDANDGYAINAWDTIEEGASADKIFIGIEIFLGLIGSLTLLIAAVGVANLMYAVVKERTREIGVKLAMGAKRRHIVIQFLLEAFFIFIKGTFWGTLLAFNIISLVRTIPISYDMGSIQSFLLRPEFSSDILIMFISAMGILVFLSGIFPAVRASRLNPVEALRYE